MVLTTDFTDNTDGENVLVERTFTLTRWWVLNQLKRREREQRGENALVERTLTLR